jgi:ribosomal protein S12 methylthiotransferase accessory factor
MELGLRTVRVIVPGFQPLHFGHEPRLGGRRLYELPRRLGISEVPARPELLNTDPHPLA